MKLTIKNGMVPYKMDAGKDVVDAEMSEAKDRMIITKGPKRASNRFPGYPICVDNKYYFAATSERTKSKKQKEKTNA